MDNLLPIHILPVAFVGQDDFLSPDLGPLSFFVIGENDDDGRSAGTPWKRAAVEPHNPSGPVHGREDRIHGLFHVRPGFPLNIGDGNGDQAIAIGPRRRLAFDRLPLQLDSRDAAVVQRPSFEHERLRAQDGSILIPGEIHVAGRRIVAFLENDPPLAKEGGRRSAIRIFKLKGDRPLRSSSGRDADPDDLEAFLDLIPARGFPSHAHIDAHRSARPSFGKHRRQLEQDVVAFAQRNRQDDSRRTG